MVGGSPYADKIKFYIGDALQLLPDMNITFDLAFVDGDKRKYIEYYELVLKIAFAGLVSSVADNTLWDAMCWKNRIIPTFKLSVSRNLMIWWQRLKVEKVILPLRDGLTIIRKK